jgi:hypothetical protein
MRTRTRLQFPGFAAIPAQALCHSFLRRKVASPIAPQIVAGERRRLGPKLASASECKPGRLLGHAAALLRRVAEQRARVSIYPP